MLTDPLSSFRSRAGTSPVLSGFFVALTLFGMLPAQPGIAAVITIDSTSDQVNLDGECTLREAIQAANGVGPLPDCDTGDPGLDTLEFAIPGQGPHVITVGTVLPDIIQDLEIRADTQTGTMCTPQPPQSLQIVLDGNGGLFDGLRFIGAGGLVRGLTVQGFASGIFGQNGTDLTIDCSYVGTGADGLTAEPNSIGIRLATFNGATIGGTGGGNLISGNATQIRLMSVSNDVTLQGNWIGLDATGRGVPDGAAQNTGVNIENETSNVTIEDNVIAGMSSRGVNLVSASSAFLGGNTIGADIDLQPLGNRIGVSLGGDAPDAILFQNLITASEEVGVSISIANPSNPFRLASNSIYGNGDLGIDVGYQTMGFHGPTSNDSPDLDDVQNHPVITSVTADGVTVAISGYLETTPLTDIEFQIYVNESCSPSGYGEGQGFRAQGLLSTDAAGLAEFDLTLPDDGGAAGDVWTALALDLTTSEFSPCALATRPSEVPLAPHVLPLFALFLAAAANRSLRRARALV